MYVAGLWGFAEATLFFLVPDIWLTAIAVRRGLKPALMACLVALAGALVGGMAMYGWGASDPDAARTTLNWIPAIDMTLMDQVRAALDEDGASAIMLGPLQGIPYKIYAIEASRAGIGLAIFLAISIPARLLRFLLVTIVAWSISAALTQHEGTRVRTGLLAGVWCAFYAAYFTIMGI